MASRKAAKGMRRKPVLPTASTSTAAVPSALDHTSSDLIEPRELPDDESPSNSIEVEEQDEPFLDSTALLQPTATEVIPPAPSPLPSLPTAAAVPPTRSLSPRPLLFPFPESESNETIFASTSSHVPAPTPRSRSLSNRLASTLTETKPVTMLTPEEETDSVVPTKSPAAAVAVVSPLLSRHAMRPQDVEFVEYVPTLAEEQQWAREKEEAKKEKEKVEPPVVVPIVSRTRSTRGSQKKVVVEVAPEEEEDDEGGDGGVTRCVCSTDTEQMSQGLMIQCDTCKCWQHGPCVGLWGEKDCPERYFCEMCRPTWHGPGGLLRKAHRKPVPPITTTATATSTTHRSPPLHSAPAFPSSSRSKPRESADAALVSAFLSADPHGSLPTASSSSTHVDRDRRSETGSPNHRQRSLSLTTGVDGKVPKKRSTMNSRDAAYDDAIALSLLESGGGGVSVGKAKSERMTTAGSALDEESGDDGRLRSKRSQSRDKVEYHEVDESGAREKIRRPKGKGAAGGGAGGGGNKRRRPSEDETALAREPKKRHTDEEEDEEAGEEHDRQTGLQEDEEDEDADAAPRVKHANQYTYRPKSTLRSRASPVKRTTTADHDHHVPLHSLPALSTAPIVHHNARGKHPREAATVVEPNGWGLPDHLKHLANLLPTLLPTPIAVPYHPLPLPAVATGTTTSTTAPLPPLTESTRDEAGDHNDDVPTHFEAPTRIRFPTRRITMPEMKKRSKHVLEFMTRIQIEMSERERRVEGLEQMTRREAGDVEMEGVVVDGGGDEVIGEGGVKEGVGAESLRMMDELTKEVIFFQQRFFSD